MELTPNTTVKEALAFLGGPEVREKLAPMYSGARAELERRLKQAIDSLHTRSAEALVFSSPLAKKNVEGVLWFLKGQRR